MLDPHKSEIELEGSLVEKMNPVAKLTFCVIILAACSVGEGARRLALRPLTRHELKAALEESGIGSDSPAGKSVVSALAGVSGLALGVGAGVGGSILFDVVTSNATMEYVASLFNSTATDSTVISKGTAQEICFRSLDEDRIGRASDFNVRDDSVEPSGEWRQTTSSATTPTSSSSSSSATSPSTVATPSTPSTTDITGTPTQSQGSTCIVLGSKFSRRRRQLVLRPGTPRQSRRMSLRKFMRRST